MVVRLSIRYIEENKCKIQWPCLKYKAATSSLIRILHVISYFQGQIFSAVTSSYIFDAVTVVSAPY